MTVVGVAGLNAVFTAPAEVGLRAIKSAADEPWVDVILAVEAKHLGPDIGLDSREWHVVRDMDNGEGKQGVAAAFRRSTMRVVGTDWRLGLAKNSVTLDRWVLTVRAQKRRPNGKWSRPKPYRVTHLVPKRGWRYWAGQIARSLAGRWHVIYWDANKLPRAIKPVLARVGRVKSRLVMRHIVGLVIAPGVPVGRIKTWRTKGLDHDIVAARIGRGSKKEK